MALDQAIYSASRDRIYGVRGGYVYEFNATTGVRIQSSRFAAPAFGDASIAYDSVNDKLFVSVWRDMAFRNDGDTNYDIIVSKRLHRLNPTTLAVEAQAEINGEPLFPGYVGADQQHLGPHRILYYNGLIYCASAGNSNTRFCTVNVNTLAVVTNGAVLPWNNGFWMDFCIQPASGPNNAQVWVVWPNEDVTPLDDVGLGYTGAYYAYEASDYAAPYNIIYGVAWCPSSGKVYGACRKQIVVCWTPNIVGSPFALTNINTGDANSSAYRIAYNPNDGLIYVPGYRSNNVVVINPATEAVVSTQTGFDSPFDCVFTPTKKWAVQQGNVPLREIP